MGAMSQAYAEKQAQLEHTDALRDELITAASRMHMMAAAYAEASPQSARNDLFRNWANDALEATRRL